MNSASALEASHALDTRVMGSEIQNFHEELDSRVVGQERAVKHVADLYQIFRGDLNPPGKPVGATLLLGPTGVGKTHLARSTADVLYDRPGGVIKIDCAEFQEGHSIAKLIGSPPGYVDGEVEPVFHPDNLYRMHTKELEISVVLFDKIEKASRTLWLLLLGILDEGILKLSRRKDPVDFSSALIFMTSNLGVKEISKLISGSIGFSNSPNTMPDAPDVDQRIYRTALNAARKHFSPEFMNRLDKIVVCRSLKEHHIRQILDLELEKIQDRITESKGVKFVFRCEQSAKDFLLQEGFDPVYGARHLKRTLTRYLIRPFARFRDARQLSGGDLVIVGANGDGLYFRKMKQGAVVKSTSQRTAVG